MIRKRILLICFIVTGADIARDIPDYALMPSVPAQQFGWMIRHGIRLPEPNSEGIMIFDESGYRYNGVEQCVVRCLDLDEEAPLPPEAAIGRISYDELKKKLRTILTVIGTIHM